MGAGETDTARNGRESASRAAAAGETARTEQNTGTWAFTLLHEYIIQTAYTSTCTCACSSKRCVAAVGAVEAGQGSCQPLPPGAQARVRERAGASRERGDLGETHQPASIHGRGLSTNHLLRLPYFLFALNLHVCSVGSNYTLTLHMCVQAYAYIIRHGVES